MHHPPWIIFLFFLHSLVFIGIVSGNEEQKESENSTATRAQREIYERERRLIPYMTYYITQNPTSTNVGTRQNIFIPITSPRENIFHLEQVSKLPLANIHNVNPQRVEVLAKPVVRIPSNPALFAPTIQAGHYKPKEEDGLLPQIYRLETGVHGPQIQTQLQSPQQIQSGTQPLQIIKVNPVPIEQKPNAPQFIKIVPVLTKLVLEDRAPKSLTLSPPQLGYSGKLQTLISGPVPSRNENSFQENKVHVSHVPQRYQQLRLVGPSPTVSQSDTSTYTIAEIAFSTTTPSPLINLNTGRPSKVENNLDQVSIAHLSQLNHAQADYEREPVPRFTSGKYVTVAPSLPQAYYSQKANGYQGEESHDLVQNLKQIPRLRVPQEEKIRFVASVTPIPVTNDLENTQGEGKAEKIYDKQPLSNIFSLLKETNKLPPKLTPENIDAGIQTLALILERLQQQTNYLHAHKIPAQASPTAEPPSAAATQGRQNPKKVHSFPEKSGTSTPGRPGIDYPTYSSIPQTNFDCSTQRYKGFFGDPDTNCQVWHYCDLNGGQASFLCPNGTIFSQVALTCDWWFNVKCASTSQLYVLNERLYKYILPFSPSFPEDYSGPVVDTYLAAKFKEMEVKSKLKALKSQSNATTTEKPERTTEGLVEGPTELSEEYKTPSIEE